MMQSVSEQWSQEQNKKHTHAHPPIRALLSPNNGVHTAHRGRMLLIPNNIWVWARQKPFTTVATNNSTMPLVQATFWEL